MSFLIYGDQNCTQYSRCGNDFGPELLPRTVVVSTDSSCAAQTSLVVIVCSFSSPHFYFFLVFWLEGPWRLAGRTEIRVGPFYELQSSSVCWEKLFWLGHQLQEQDKASSVSFWMDKAPSLSVFVSWQYDLKADLRLMPKESSLINNAPREQFIFRNVWGFLSAASHQPSFSVPPILHRCC